MDSVLQAAGRLQDWIPACTGMTMGETVFRVCRKIWVKEGLMVVDCVCRNGKI